MFNSHTQINGETPAAQQLTQSEFGVIQQLRRLQQQRVQYIPMVNRHEPLGLINYDDRQFLEIRQNFLPILVPTHMLTTVRTFISQNLPRHIRSLGAQPQSPPQSPPTSQPPYMPTSPLSEISQTSQTPQPTFSTGSLFYDSTSPLGLNGMGMSLAQPSAPVSEPVPIPQIDNNSALLTSLPSNFATSSISGMINGGFNPATSPRQNRYISAEDLLTAAMKSKGSLVHSRSPSISGKISKRSESTKLLKSPKMLQRGQDSKGQSMQTNRAICEDCVDDKASKNPNADVNIMDIVSKYYVSDNEDDELRKPANAFILYRQSKNQALRKQKPGISVEAASSVIGKSWREESEEVKSIFKELAQVEREKYFAKKKRVLARQKVKKAERDEVTLSPTPRSPQKAPELLPKTKAPSQISFSESRGLSSFAPEALAKSSLNVMSHQDHSNLQMLQPRNVNALTVNTDPNIAGSSLLRDYSYPGNSMNLELSGMGSAIDGLSSYDRSRLFPEYANLDSFFTTARTEENSVSQEFSRQVASSMEKLTAAYSQTQSQSTLTTMAIDQSLPTTYNNGGNGNGSVDITNNSNGNTSNSNNSSGMDWAPEQMTNSSGFENMLNSYFNKNS
ncbi:hypothetical protein LPJ66_002620 [Kickxella alabastrina]|uniref:Uncharacterized protein n=1 Tax=Kickxella alabastrina TaxID=61397 RepID=A0ACC1IQ02_9FUNG|nr:hypothetical protein LPJ66_002620 [Kickxella alabastrina]